MCRADHQICLTIDGWSNHVIMCLSALQFLNIHRYLYLLFIYPSSRINVYILFCFSLKSWFGNEPFIMWLHFLRECFSSELMFKLSQQSVISLKRCDKWRDRLKFLSCVLFQWCGHDVDATTHRRLDPRGDSQSEWCGNWPTHLHGGLPGGHQTLQQVRVGRRAGKVRQVDGRVWISVIPWGKLFSRIGLVVAAASPCRCMLALALGLCNTISHFEPSCVVCCDGLLFVSSTFFLRPSTVMTPGFLGSGRISHSGFFLMLQLII